MSSEPPRLVARLRDEQKNGHSQQSFRRSSSGVGVATSDGSQPQNEASLQEHPRGGAAPAGGSSSRTTAAKHPLSAHEMDRASRLAAVNDYVYTIGPDALEGKLAAAGLTLLAQGHNQYTRWFVAQGRLPRVSPSRSEDPLREEQRRRRGDITGEHALIRAELQPQDEHGDDDASDWPVERLVFIRGVMWRDSNVSHSTLWQELANAWPEPFSVPGEVDGDVVVHRGVARIARAVWEQVLPWILDVSDSTPLTFAGHSLGGALALILTAKARSRLRIPASSLSCHAFGSPGIMGAARGGGGGAPTEHQGGGGAPGDRVCRILGLDPSSIRWFCLDDDPVPRAMLAVDPVYSMLKQTDLGAQVLGWRGSMDADGPLTLERCLYEPIGRHFLLRWDSASRTRLVEVASGGSSSSGSPSEVLRLEEAMRVEVQGMIEDPMRLLKAMADHRQSSYVSELMMAAQDVRGDHEG